VSARSLALRAGLALLGLAAGLLLAEGVVRLAGAAPEVVLIEEGRFRLSPNPRLGYEPVAHVDYHGPLTSFHDYIGTSNARGFRDVDHEPEKPAGITRIVVLGDSVAAGQGLRLLEETLPRRLEAELTGAGARVEVISLAVSGYDTGQEVAMLADRGLAYDPDWVVVAYCLNDWRRSDGGILAALRERQARQGESGRLAAHLYHPLWVRSALYRLLRHRLAGPPAEAPRPADDGPRDSRPEALTELAGLAETHGFRTLLAIYPQLHDLARYPASARAQHRQVAELAAERGIPVLDLLDAFRTCRETAGEPIAFNRYHPTAAGHACGARAVAEELIRRGV
jgi:lysophospholipase L1-like esterase